MVSSVIMIAALGGLFGKKVVVNNYWGPHPATMVVEATPAATSVPVVKAAPVAVSVRRTYWMPPMVTEQPVVASQPVYEMRRVRVGTRCERVNGRRVCTPVYETRLIRID